MRSLKMFKTLMFVILFSVQIYAESGIQRFKNLNGYELDLPKCWVVEIDGPQEEKVKLEKEASVLEYKSKESSQGARNKMADMKECI